MGSIHEKTRGQKSRATVPLNPKLLVDHIKFSRENLQIKLLLLRIVLSIVHIVALIV
jgi:hypothetical protein